ncbi:MAG: sigma-70 family RNA polymerase sigma factor, partial [Terriglobales bacterium]
SKMSEVPWDERWPERATGVFGAVRVGYAAAPSLEPEPGEAATVVADLARVFPWGQDECEFVAELQAGSESAFDYLVTHYHALVYNVLFGMLGNSADAADAAQEVFLKAFRGIRSFRRGSSLKTWLYRIAIREALNQRRWWWRHRRREVPIEGDENQEHPALDLPDTHDSPFDQFAARETQAVVHRALATVPEVFRGAVILRDLEGLSYEEVAEVLDVSVGTVKSRILRGRRALVEALRSLLEENSPARTTRAGAVPMQSAAAQGGGE